MMPGREYATGGTPQMTVTPDHEVDELIARYIEPQPARDGITEAHVKGSTAPVWAVIANFRMSPADDAAELIADGYGISIEAMRAAIEYYKRHQAAIDARIAGLSPS